MQHGGNTVIYLMRLLSTPSEGDERDAGWEPERRQAGSAVSGGERGLGLPRGWELGRQLCMELGLGGPERAGREGLLRCRVQVRGRKPAVQASVSDFL